MLFGFYAILNYNYDIVDIDSGTLQYTHYSEGQFYNWHSDADLETFMKPQIRYSSGDNKAQDQTLLAGEYIRKLSFTLQLSEPDEYEGGNVQFIDDENKTFFAPRQRGSMVLFDSRTQHRVLKVKKGVRRSIVGWVLGPRWK